MKRIYHLSYLCLGVLAAFLTSCGNDSPAAMSPTLPTNGGDPVKEIIHNGTLPDCCDWALTYSDKRLLSAVGTSYINGTTQNATFSLSYGPQSVAMRGNDNKQYTIDLNGNQFISRMTVDDNIYEFNYWGKNLSNWRKTVVGADFAPVLQYTSSASISYDGGDLKQIVYTENENNPLNSVTLTFTSDSRLNVNGLLPEGVTRELGVLGFEHLFYAGLMGSSTVHLVKSVDVKYAQYPERDYSLEFEYSADQSGKNVVLCNYRYKGQPASVTYKY